ncbi:TPA: hypothetical protein NJY08_004768 [Salmonella enterica subsp. enterica serovar Typhi str. AG3]|nr:hypothetical protein [Salmonella enterica subsp. enterica serovar Typhi str. AG3]
MFRNVNHFKQYLENHRGIVFNVDVKCLRCERISINGTQIYADDVLDTMKTGQDFYNFNHFYCQNCKHAHRFDVDAIRKIKAGKNLYSYILSTEEGLQIQDYELWENTKTSQFKLIKKDSVFSTFSNAENIAFIPMEKEYLNAKEQLQQKVNQEENIDNVIHQLLEEGHTVLSPSIINLDNTLQYGLIINSQTSKVTFASDQQRANFTEIDSYCYLTYSYFLDPFNNKSLSDPNYFDVTHEITISELYKVTFTGSIKPRKYYQIVTSDNDNLVGMYIELRLNPCLQQYVIHQLVDKIPDFVLESGVGIC